MRDTDPVQRARATALRYLSFRPRTEAEVHGRLRRRFSAPVVEQVMERLREQGLVDDAAFASLWTASREAHNPKSAWAIGRELVAKGIERTAAGEAVRGMDDEENAYRAGLKAAGRLAHADLTTFRRRLWGYLKRRGFSDSVCRRTIERIRDEARPRNGSSAHETP